MSYSVRICCVGLFVTRPFPLPFRLYALVFSKNFLFSCGETMSLPRFTLQELLMWVTVTCLMLGFCRFVDYRLTTLVCCIALIVGIVTKRFSRYELWGFILGAFTFVVGLLFFAYISGQVPFSRFRGDSDLFLSLARQFGISVGGFVGASIGALLRRSGAATNES